MSMRVNDDHFDRQFPDTPDGRLQLARHTAFLFNRMQEQTDQYEESLRTIINALKEIPAVKLTLNIRDILDDV